MAEKKKFNKIGSIREGDYGLYIKFDDDIELFRDGEKIPLKKNCLNLRNPKNFIEFLRENDYISDQEAEKRLDFLNENPWLRSEIIIPKKK